MAYHTKWGFHIFFLIALGFLNYSLSSSAHHRHHLYGQTQNPCVHVDTHSSHPSLLSCSCKTTRYYRNISPTYLGLQKEKLSHLRFYLHDILSGPKPTTVEVAEAQMTNTSSTHFGLVLMADDPMTVGPEPESKLVGKAQGMFGFAAQDETGLMMILNFAFTEGKYNGSTLTMVGRNMVLSAVRELPIVGGSGAFRFARGYAQVETRFLDNKTGDAILEYNLYVFHY